MAKNKLFQLASRAARYQARQTFSRTLLGKSLNAAKRQISGGTFTQLRRQIRKAGREVSMQDLTRRTMRDVQRYSLTGMAMQAVNNLLGSLGPLGHVIRSQLYRRRRPADQLKAAADLLRSYGYEILGKDTRWPGYERGEEAAKQLLEQAGYRVLPNGAVIPEPKPVWEQQQQEDGDEPQSLTYTRPQPPRDEQAGRPSASAPSQMQQPEDEQEEGEDEPVQVTVTPEIRTPSSSNVYSFQYDYKRSTLYVRYQEHSVNPNAIRGSKAGGRAHVRGTLGHTVGGKTGGPGASYAYYDVPVRVFEKLVRAPSAGRAVWDELRIRGTAYGHRFRYGLASAQTVRMEDGTDAVYVPRRITPQGFRARTLAVEGTGRRIYAHSALPEEARNFRGRPNRGRPDRGRP